MGVETGMSRPRPSVGLLAGIGRRWSEGDFFGWVSINMSLLTELSEMDFGALLGPAFASLALTQAGMGCAVGAGEGWAVEEA
jgi:hypothetical protein